MERTNLKSANRSSIQKSSGFLPGLFFILISAVLAVSSVLVLEPHRERSRSSYVSPPDIKHFTFGTKELTADMLWLRAIQDFDYCEKEVAKQRCVSEGWLFKMLDLVTDLSPKFRMPYAVGGVALTVIVNDFAGASRIFDKGVAAFPKDWAILSRAAYHSLYEEEDKGKAARLLRQSAENGGPPWYYYLANRLATETGDLEFTAAMIQQLESEPNPDPLILKNLKMRLEKARAGQAVPRFIQNPEDAAKSRD